MERVDELHLNAEEFFVLEEPAIVLKLIAFVFRIVDLVKRISPGLEHFALMLLFVHLEVRGVRVCPQINPPLSDFRADVRRIQMANLWARVGRE